MTVVAWYIRFICCPPMAVSIAICSALRAEQMAHCTFVKLTLKNQFLWHGKDMPKKLALTF